MGDVLQDAMREVVQSRAAKFKHAYDGPYEVLMGFFHAVDWANESWLQALLAAELVLVLVVFLSRKWQRLQLVLFLFICALVYSAEWLNAYGREHWREFSKQNYFDEHGFFAGMVFAGPLLLLMFFQMLNAVYEAGALLIESKRAEVRAKRRASATGKKDQ
ncbi:Transmembrane protein 18 [Hondaea fermentalgiana]|uniref:Transmembrane protein 18 n=1 Tax=Hondaea fermentalgiana TaxID=2315210 RepID=A0A2R5GPX9_9STRA|nr:Transmembrane protein 18 [Hondaea fermentalgiana]|eukprot:GBG32932.1 Transmembrane protein 18 [Hondaea fermentalgiana]